MYMRYVNIDINEDMDIFVKLRRWGIINSLELNYGGVKLDE